ncbi:MAG: apolipoprotein N-acyltransferase [Gemmatimonadota bacterium]
MRSRLRPPGGGGTLLLSALLAALAFPPFDLVVPSLVALAPLAVWVEAAPSGRTAFRGGLWFGAVLWLLLLRWLPLTLARFFPEALPGWLLVVGALALVTAGAVWAAHTLRHRVGLPLWLALPLAWTAGEWLRARLPGSLAFPWLDLGTSLAGHPEWVGIAEVVGGRGVGFLLALAGALAGWAWVGARGAPSPGEPAVRRSGRRRALVTGARLGAALAVVGLPAAWGAHRARTLPTRPSLRVAILQTAVPQGVKADPSAAAEAGMASLERLLPRIADDGTADVVLLPEAVFPVRLEAAEAATLRERLERAVAEAGVPVLLGALGTAGSGGRRGGATYNSIFMVRPEGGLADLRYDKRHLVPVIERIPLPAWPGGGDGGPGGSYGFGRSPIVFPVRGASGRRTLVGPLICLESSFARAARDLRRAGADVLVNPTNDAWLNAPSPRRRTSALEQHPAHLVMRAIETRTGAARAANTGVSLFVDPSGRTRGALPVFREGVSIHTLRTTDETTPFVRWGDVVGTGAFSLTLLLALLPLTPLRSVLPRPHGA